MKFEDITTDDLQLLANGISWMESEGWWDELDDEVNRAYEVLNAISEKLATNIKK